MKLQGLFCFIVLFLSLAGCSSKMRSIIDDTKVSDFQKMDRDVADCVHFASTIDLTDEKLVRGSIAGASIAGGVAGVAMAVAGGVYAPAMPFIAAGAVLGLSAGIAKGEIDEKQAREYIYSQCLMSRGYTVFTPFYQEKSPNIQINIPLQNGSNSSNLKQ